jgi:hypothetical protein
MSRMKSIFAMLMLAAAAGVVLQTVLLAVQTQPPLTVQERQYSFTLKPGGSFKFTLPNVKSPIRIEVSFPTTNGGVQEPSEVMWALVNKDSGNGNITWIGTNSDGTTVGSNSLQNTDIANITCGTNCMIASLTVANASAGQLAMNQSSTTTTIPGSYIVRLYY